MLIESFDEFAVDEADTGVRERDQVWSDIPTEQAALKCLYLALMGLDSTGRGRGGWTMR